MVELHHILRKIRIDKSLTQANIADDLNISLTAYAKIERGETDINYSRIKQIANYYGLSLQDLFAYESRSSILLEIDYKSEQISHLKEIIKLQQQRIDLLEKQVNHK